METPAPKQNDFEDVATALETAAIFAAKNDALEAGHWLGRAAECASQHGDVVRASELEQAATALSQEFLEDAEATRDRRLPTPPPRRVSVRPPPPSERSPSQVSSDSQPMLLVRPASSSAPAPAKPNPRPSAAPASSKSAGPSTSSSPLARTSSAPLARASSSRPMTAAALSPKATPLPIARDHQEESAVRESSPSASRSASSAKPLAHFETNRPFRLHGARASITQSAGSNRFYVLKVLDDGEPVPEDGQEAFILLADPNTKLAR